MVWCAGFYRFVHCPRALIGVGIAWPSHLAAFARLCFARGLWPKNSTVCEASALSLVALDADKWKHEFVVRNTQTAPPAVDEATSGCSG